MGVVNEISYDKFPKQGKMLGKPTKVCFRYQGEYIWGTVVRDDMSAPGITIIRLVDGRHVLASECQYEHPRDDPEYCVETS